MICLPTRDWCLTGKPQPYWPSAELRHFPTARNVHLLTLVGDGSAGSRTFGCSPVGDIPLQVI